MEDLKLQKTIENNRKALISRFNNSIEPALIKAGKDFIEQGPGEAILEIFDEAVRTIGQREGKKTKIDKRLDFFIKVLGRITPGEITDDNKLKFVQAVAGGLTVDVSTIEGFEVSFKGPENIELGFSLHSKNDDYEPTRNKLFWNIGNSSNGGADLNSVDLESLSYKIATKVNQGDYRYTPVDYGGSYN